MQYWIQKHGIPADRPFPESELFSKYRHLIDKSTPCAKLGDREWKSLSDFFPDFEGNSDSDRSEAYKNEPKGEYAKCSAHANERSANGNRSTASSVHEEIRFARILELSGKISREDIKRKYRELVHKYHPDKVSHLGDEFKDLAHQKFKEINEAYQYFRNKYGID